MGKHTKSGYLAKHYFIVRCMEHPDEAEVVAGEREILAYGEVKRDQPRRGRPRKYRTEMS